MIFDDETPQEDHADLFIRAVNLYGEITGVPVPQHENDGRFGRFTFGTYEIRKRYDHLRDAIDLDPSTLTANLMLSYFVRDHLANQTLSLLSLMADPDAYLAKVVKPKELLDITNRDDVVAARDGFIERLRRALERYGAAEREDVKKVLANTDQIAFLRRDALKGAQRMQMHQFLDGDPEPADVKPVYHTQVFQWWNINSLLNAATTMPSGVSLNLIRDKDEYQSYFCWCIRNGGRLIVLTDAPEYAHPLQGQMTRRPDRALGERSVQAWFPYDLLGLKWDEESERYYIEKSDHTALAVYQQEHKVLKPLAEIGAEELIWAVMMLDQIVDRFWAKGETAKQLSYTGEMLKIEDRLIEKAKGSALMKVGAYEPLNLPKLTLDDIRTEALKPEHIGKMGFGVHQWMADRYGDRVRPEVLNTVAQPGTLLLGSGQPLKDYWSKKEIEGTQIEGGIRAFTSSEVAGVSQSGRAEKGLVFFDSTKFGTREQIEADRVWLARHNYATEIGRMAHAEFEDRAAEIEAWLRARIEKNLPNLAALAGHGELWVYAGVYGNFDTSGVGGITVKLKDGWLNDEKSLKARRFMRIIDIAEERRSKDYDFSRFAALHFGWDNHAQVHICPITGARASYRVQFRPATPVDLAFLCGVAVAELPDVLQHWGQGERYVGNSILNRIDPLEWAIENPWAKKTYGIQFGLSKRGLTKMQKDPPVVTLDGVLPPEEVKADGGPSGYLERLRDKMRAESGDAEKALDSEAELD